MRSKSIVTNGDLIKKVAVPKLVFPMAARGFEHHQPAVVADTAGRCWFRLLRHPFYWTWIYLPVPLLALAIFTLGMTFFFAAANVYYRDVAHILQIVLSAWFYVTPIIYPLDIMPAQYHWIFKLNPIIYVINGFRLRSTTASCPRRRRSSPRLSAPLSACSSAFLSSGNIRTTLSSTSKLPMSIDRAGNSIGECHPALPRHPGASGHAARAVLQALSRHKSSYPRFRGGEERLVRSSARADAGNHRAQRIRQEHAAEDHRRRLPADRGHGQSERHRWRR